MRYLTSVAIETLVTIAKMPGAKRRDIRMGVEDALDREVNAGRVYDAIKSLENAGLCKNVNNETKYNVPAYEITTEGVKTLEQLEETIQSGLERCYAQ